MPPRIGSRLGGPKADAPRRDDLLTLQAVTLQREDRLIRDTAVVEVMLGDQFFTVRIKPLNLKYNGFWSQFVCPSCERLARVLRLLDDRLVCKRCDGLLYRSQLDNRAGRRRHSAAMKDGTIDRLVASLDHVVRSRKAVIRRIRSSVNLQREFRLKGYRAYFDPDRGKRKPRRKTPED